MYIDDAAAGARRWPRRLAVAVGWRMAEDTIKIGLLATFEGAVHGARRGQHARRRDGGQGAQRHGRRQEDRDRQGLVRRLAGQRRARHAQAGRAGRRRRSWSARCRATKASRSRTTPRPSRTSPSSTARRRRRTRRCAIRRPTSSASPPTARSGWPASATTPTTTKGYKKVATVAEDYSFPYTQVFGFMADVLQGRRPCASKKFWVPIGNKDFSSVIAAIPDDVDAIYVALGGADAVNFLTQYQQAGGSEPLIGGSITVDQTVLSSKGKTARCRHRHAVGRPDRRRPTTRRHGRSSSRPTRSMPNGFPSPSLFAHGYYINTKALLTALDKVNGDLSDGGAKLRDGAGEPRRSTRRPARSRSTRTATPSPTSS